MLVDCGGLAMVRVHRRLLHVRPQLLVVPTLRRPAHLHQHTETRVKTPKGSAGLYTYPVSSRGIASSRPDRAHIKQRPPKRPYLLAQQNAEAFFWALGYQRRQEPACCISNQRHLLQGGAGHVLQQRAVLPHLVGQLFQLPLLERFPRVDIRLHEIDDRQFTQDEDAQVMFRTSASDRFAPGTYDALVLLLCFHLQNVMCLYMGRDYCREVVA